VKYIERAPGMSTPCSTSTWSFTIRVFLWTMRIECSSIEDPDGLLQMRVEARTGPSLENLAMCLERVTIHRGGARQTRLSPTKASESCAYLTVMAGTESAALFDRILLGLRR
jgi:hypothetical protein